MTTTDFISAQHPRIDNGTFTAKEQTSPEFDKLFTNALLSSSPRHELKVDELVTISHADGDFDADDLGIEGVLLWRDGEGLHAEAYTDLDFHNLEGPHSTDQAAHTIWLDKNRGKIAAAVAAAYPGMYFGPNDQSGGDWETQSLMIGLTTAPESQAPDTTAEIVDLVRENPTVKAFGEGAGVFFDKVAYQMRLADLNTELATA